MTSCAGCAKPERTICFGVPEMPKAALLEVVDVNFEYDYPAIERYLAELERNCGVISGQ